MAKTLLESVNEGLRTIGEPDITAFTSTNQLQNVLISQANDTVHDILESARYRWGLRNDALVLEAAIDTGTVAVTNGSTTVTSKDASGDDADNFTNVEAGDWVRVGTDLTSYEVASVDTASSPDTITLTDEYQGSTSTSASYKVIHDTYSISTSHDEIFIASYGEKTAFSASREIQVVDMPTIYRKSGGDLHRNTSGYPEFMAQIANDASENKRYVFWPYPDDEWVIHYWYTESFTSNTTAATNMFGGDAPDIAYDAVTHKIRWRACIYDNDFQQAQQWKEEYERSYFQLVSRESRTHREENQIDVETYRSNFLRNTSGHPVVSQIIFDRS